MKAQPTKRRNKEQHYKISPTTKPDCQGGADAATKRKRQCKSKIPSAVHAQAEGLLFADYDLTRYRAKSKSPMTAAAISTAQYAVRCAEPPIFQSISADETAVIGETYFAAGTPDSVKKARVRRASDICTALEVSGMANAPFLLCGARREGFAPLPAPAPLCAAAAPGRRVFSVPYYRRHGARCKA